MKIIKSNNLISKYDTFFLTEVISKKTIVSKNLIEIVAVFFRLYRILFHEFRIVFMCLYKTWSFGQIFHQSIYKTCLQRMKQ